MGYHGFTFYNRFIAESVTNQGRQILSTAANGFESFLGSGVTFSTIGECMEFILNIKNEYKESYTNLNVSVFDTAKIEDEVADRILKNCKFRYDEVFINQLKTIIDNSTIVEKVLFYYKRNLKEFNKNQFIIDKYKYLMDNIDELTLPDVNQIKDPQCKQIALDIWDFYKVFVLYDYPIFDRVRKNLYLDKEDIVGEDTDSNFICLNKLVSYIKNDVMKNKFNKSDENITFISVNLMAYYLGLDVDSALQSLCRYMNVTPEYAKRLAMKNEFYQSRMVFTNKKKRYLSNSILQEGQLLNNGEGLVDIKGFDFKKSTTKPFVRAYYEDICYNDILKAKEIRVDKIFAKLMILKSDIEESMKKGESKYFKQANVQIAEHYKKPYSSQGYTSILLWNALCPKYAMELPTDTDIVPIKDLRNKSNMEWFKNKYPEAFELLNKNILLNNNKELSNIGLKYIAKPKNADIPLPEWFSDLVDSKKIVNDTLSLFYPIMESLGPKVLKTTSTVSYLSNMVDL